MKKILLAMIALCVVSVGYAQDVTGSCANSDMESSGGRCYCTTLNTTYSASQIGNTSSVLEGCVPYTNQYEACSSGRYRNDENARCQNDEGRMSAENEGTRGEFGSSPLEILDNVTDRANVGRDGIQSTALDEVSHAEGSYPATYRLANTFDSIRKKLAPYLDRLFYIGLSVAVILLIWQGLQLVIGKTLSDIRKPLTNIVVGVVILTGVYLIIKLVTSLLALIFNI